MNTKEINQHLYNWSSLMRYLKSIDKKNVKEAEPEVKRMLEHEIRNGRRAEFITRLHQRYTRLRANRERKELFLKQSEK